MFKDFGFPRSLITYGVCLPLAVLLGYLVATPRSFTSIAFIGLVLMIIFFPLVMRWHHFLVICSWNALFNAFFLPGQAGLWVVFSCVSLFIALVNRTLRAESGFIAVPSVGRPLILLTAIVAVTILLTGGIGGRSMGSELWGAKRYIGVFGAVIGYWALTSQRIPSEKAPLYAGAYFLSGLTALFSHLAYAAGPKLYFLFSLFSPELAVGQAISQDYLLRLPGAFLASMSGIYFLLMRYGIRGIADLTRPWRLLALAVLTATSLFGGYRSAVLFILLALVLQFYLESLFRTKLFPISLLVSVVIGAAVIVFVDRLPLAIQRSLSFLPVKVDRVAKADAIGTLDWRFEIWKAVLPEVPKYLFLGKGYSFSGADLSLTAEAMRRGYYSSYENVLVDGNYHNGFLTLMIPFGIFGLLAFLWFSWSATRVLYLNYKHGDESLKKINTFLLTYFMVRLVYFWGFYGQFDMDLMVFTGTVGLSIAINGGVKTKEGEGVVLAAPRPSPNHSMAAEPGEAAC